MLCCVPLCNRQDLDRLMRREEDSSPIPTDRFKVDDWVVTILREYLARQDDGDRLVRLFQVSRPQLLREIEEARLIVWGDDDDDVDSFLLFSVNEGIRAINRIIRTHTIDRLS